MATWLILFLEAALRRAAPLSIRLANYLIAANFSYESEFPCGSFSPKSWRLIRSKSSQEDRACYNLSQMGIEILCPHIESKPLFPGYLFGNFSLESLSSVNSAYGVLKVVQFGKTPAEVPESVIEEIRLRINDMALQVRVGREYQRGEKVRVLTGPFKDWQGVFDSRVSGKDRVRILLNTVWAVNTTCYQETRGMSTAVEIGLNELVSA